MKKKYVLLLLVIFCILICLPSCSPPRYTLRIAEHSAEVELARTREERAQGLMFRESLDADSGMLFVFERPGLYSFWMKNTLIPLSIAFIDQLGVIVNIEEMKPHDERTVFPKANALYALEMNAGWFAARGITAGMRIHFGARLAKKFGHLPESEKGVY